MRHATCGLLGPPSNRRQLLRAKFLQSLMRSLEMAGGRLNDTQPGVILRHLLQIGDLFLGLGDSRNRFSKRVCEKITVGHNRDRGKVNILCPLPHDTGDVSELRMLRPVGIDDHN